MHNNRWPISIRFNELSASVFLLLGQNDSWQDKTDINRTESYINIHYDAAITAAAADKNNKENDDD